MITIHHLGLSQSDRIVWLCEELPLPYELKIYAREPGNGRAPADYRQLHPMEMAPVITDGEVTLAESGAIVEYILRRYGGKRLQPADTSKDLPAYLYWLHFANATLQPSAVLALVLGQTDSGRDDRLRLLGERFQRCLAHVEDRLDSAPYFAGDDLTAADIMMVFNLSKLLTLTGASIDEFPAISAYLARIEERPAYRRAMRMCADEITAYPRSHA